MLAILLKIDYYPFFPKKNETTATTITAPRTEGINAMPAKLGPHVPNIACPTDEPTKPATTLAITPIAPPLLVMAPARNPIKPPTIIDHNIQSLLPIQSKYL